MDKIVITDLEVFYHIGVPEEERAKPQRLLLVVELSQDLGRAATTDDLADTINYYALVQRLVRFGDGRSWKLLEKLAADLAKMILDDFAAEAVAVEVKKFIIPETRHVSVRIERKKMRAVLSRGSARGGGGKG